MSLCRIACLILLCFTTPLVFAQSDARAERARRAQEEFYRIRAWPGTALPSGARIAALAEMDRMRARERKTSPEGLGPVWKLIGPRPLLTLAEQSSVSGAPYSS